MTRETDSTPSAPTSTPPGSDSAHAAASADRLERHGAVDASDGDGSTTTAGDSSTTYADDETNEGPIELAAAGDRCRTCGATIGPRERRLSWIVETETATLEAHYCSEACLPDDPPAGSRSSTERSDSSAPRDWSYCR